MIFFPLFGKTKHNVLAVNVIMTYLESIDEILSKENSVPGFLRH